MALHEMVSKYRDRLIEFFKPCRVDLHEPDEQGFKEVTLFGNHLDNACGDRLDSNEYVVRVYRHRYTEDETYEDFNLANLIALARFSHYDPEVGGLLRDAIVQIEYLHEKFKETGTGNNVIARLQTHLNKKGY